MAKKDLTVEGVKKAKVELEATITKMLQDFEKDYDVKLGYFDIKRKRDKNDDKVCCEPQSPRDIKPIETVDINMNIDF